MTFPVGLTVISTTTLPAACSFSFGTMMPSSPGLRPSRLNETPIPVCSPATELPCTEPIASSLFSASSFLLMLLPLLNAFASLFSAASRASASLRSRSMRSASSRSFCISSGVFSGTTGSGFFSSFSFSGGNARLSSLSWVISGSSGVVGAGFTGAGSGATGLTSAGCAMATVSTSMPNMTSTPFSGGVGGGSSTRKYNSRASSTCTITVPAIPIIFSFENLSITCCRGGV